MPWLKFQQSISRATRKGLEPLHTAGLGEDSTATALYAWNETLYLLLRVRDEAPAPSGEMVESELISGDRQAMLEAMQREGRGAHHWELHSIDPRSGRLLVRYRLPAMAERLRLIPGPHSWGLLEEGTAPNMKNEGHKTILTLLPARWFSSRGDGQAVELTCL